MTGREHLVGRSTGAMNSDRGLRHPESGTEHVARMEVCSLGRRRQWQEALALFHTVSDPGPMMTNAALDACAKSLQLEPALQLFSLMRMRTNASYNVIIDLLGRLRRVSEAERLFADMSEQCLHPDVVTYSSLIMAHGTAHDVDSALRLFSKMPSVGIPRCSQTFAAILSACAKTGAVDHAAQLLAEMETSSLQPNLGHMTSAVAACARRQDEARARSFFEEMDRRTIKPDVIAYTALISCHVGVDALLRAEALFAEMEGRGIQPDSFAFNAMLKVALQLRAAGKFQEILALMEARGQRRTAETRRLVEQMERSESAVRASTPAASTPAAARELPSGWHASVDPASGRSYYWMASNPEGTTTWEFPT